MLSKTCASVRAKDSDTENIMSDSFLTSGRQKRTYHLFPLANIRHEWKKILIQQPFKIKKKTSSLEDISLNRLTLQTVRALADLFICGGWSGEREHPLYGLICRVSVMLAGFTSLRRGMGGVATGDLKAIWCRYRTPKLLAEHDTTAFFYALCSVLNNR